MTDVETSSPESSFVLPPHHDVITLSPLRWWIVWNSLIDKEGDVTAGVRTVIWDALKLAGGPDEEAPLSLVFLSHTVSMIRTWEARITP